jgi:hypothetical protein
MSIDEAMGGVMGFALVAGAMIWLGDAEPIWFALPAVALVRHICLNSDIGSVGRTKRGKN